MQVVLLVRVVKLSQPPVDDAELTLLVVNNNVVGLDVPVHDAIAVSIVESLQHLVHVVAGIFMVPAVDELVKVSCIDVFHCERRYHCFRVNKYVEQLDDVRPAAQRLENGELPANSMRLDRTETLENDLFAVSHVQRLIDPAVDAASNTFGYLVVLLFSPPYKEQVVVPDARVSLCVHVRVRAGPANDPSIVLALFKNLAFRSRLSVYAEEHIAAVLVGFFVG
mmetsp:Transcript_3756/g.11185  ORF Transcript_3756/g.11185 Transcript_3756/m.11185 type:complete len:223 (+) Transcript_3756:676-1344(+)